MGEYPAGDVKHETTKEVEAMLKTLGESIEKATALAIEEAVAPLRKRIETLEELVVEQQIDVPDLK